MKKLYEIDDEIERILAQEVDPETGEITDSTLHHLEALEMERDAKVLDVLAYAKGELREGEAVKAEADRLMRRAKIHLGRYERLCRYAQDHAEPGKEVSDHRTRVRWRKSKAVEIDDARQLPRDVMIVSERPSKTKIGERLRQGLQVAGARFVERLHMQVE